MNAEAHYTHDYFAPPASDASISVVLPALNEGDEVDKTLRSLRETACEPDNYSAVVVDQGGQEIRDQKCVRIRTSPQGPDMARIRGFSEQWAHIMITCDAHMRFVPGWDRLVRAAVHRHPEALHQGSVGNLGDPQPTWAFGGNLEEDPAGFRVVKYQGGNYHGLPRYVPCTGIIGAFYFWSTDLGIHELWPRYFHGWGHAEEWVSLACQRYGIPIYTDKCLRVLHKYRPAHPYPVRWEGIWYNRHITEATFSDNYESRRKTMLPHHPTFNETSSPALLSTPQSHIFGAARHVDFKRALTFCPKPPTSITHAPNET